MNNMTQEEIQKANDIIISIHFKDRLKFYNTDDEVNYGFIFFYCMEDKNIEFLEFFLKDERFELNWNDLTASMKCDFRIFKMIFGKNVTDPSSFNNVLIWGAINTDMEEKAELLWTDKRVRDKARAMNDNTLIAKYRKNKINKLLEDFDTSNE